MPRMSFSGPSAASSCKCGGGTGCRSVGDGVGMCGAAPGWRRRRASNRRPSAASAASVERVDSVKAWKV
eukprot:96162-Chlamydomonas_euryale.AAC.1